MQTLNCGTDVLAEERDFDEAGVCVDGDGFGLARAGFQDDAADAELPRFGFERDRQFADRRRGRGGGGDVHPLDFGDARFDTPHGAAADGLVVEIGDEKRAAAFGDFFRRRGGRSSRRLRGRRSSSSALSARMSCCGYRREEVFAADDLRRMTAYFVDMSCLVACRYSNDRSTVHQAHVTTFDSHLSKNILHHMPVHVGQPVVAALVLVRELRVVDAQQVQDRRLQVVDVDGAGREFVFRG